MAAGTQSHTEAVESDARSVPEISCCDAGPQTSVFLESDNTDGWISTDTTVEVSR